MKKITFLSFLVILIDQVIKLLVTNNITYLKSITIIPDFFYLTHVHNEGAAWSMFSGNTIFLILIAVMVLFFIYYFLLRGKKFDMKDTIIYSLLIGGIIGNLIDRIIFKYVIDYLDFIFGSYSFPVFNFADICIVLSVIILLFYSFKEELCKKSK